MKTYQQFKENLDDRRLAAMEKQRDIQAKMKQKSDEYKLDKENQIEKENEKDNLKQEIKKELKKELSL